MAGEMVRLRELAVAVVAPGWRWRRERPAVGAALLFAGVAVPVIVALVLPRSLSLLWHSAEVLLERVPRGVDTQEVQDALEGLPGVVGVHDLHIWSTDGITPLATCHLVVADDHQPSCGVLDRAQGRLRDFGVEHSTIQLEYPGHRSHEQVC